MIAVDPHKASNTAAVLDPVTKTVIGLPRAFRTADLELFHAARCRFRYSLWTSCGVL
jgi:hypothetical protein